MENILLPFTEGTQNWPGRRAELILLPRLGVEKYSLEIILLIRLYEVCLIDTDNSQWKRERMCQVDVIKRVLLDSNENCGQLSSCLKQPGCERARN